jgi:hypothetical protein
MTSMINASHLDVELSEELIAARDARWRQQDAKAGISPAPPPKPPAPAPKPEQPKPKPTAATKSPAPGAKKPASGRRSNRPRHRCHPAASC